MKIQKKGTNIIICELSNKEIKEFGYEIKSLKEDAEKKEVTERLDKFFSLTLAAISGYLNPMAELLPMPLRTGLYFEENMIEVLIEANLPFDIFDIEDDFEEEINLTDALPEDYEGLYGDDYDSNSNIEEKKACIIVMNFKSMNDIIRYISASSHIADKPKAKVYKMKDKYHMICDFSEIDDKTMQFYKNICLEWCVEIESNKMIDSYIEEHGEQIISDDAFSILMQLS